MRPLPSDQCPLQEEIYALAKYHPYASIVIIDDWKSLGRKDFNFPGEDWTHISMEIILNISGEERVKYAAPINERQYVICLRQILI